MPVTVQNLKDLQRKMWKLFNYQYDKKNYGIMEHWQSHADAVERNEQFTDDCDGYAFTVCETLLRMGANPADVKFIVCEAETGEGHAIAGYTIGNQTYILENRYPQIYDWQKRPGYKFNYYMQFDKPGQWYDIIND
jgi:predicted transglutaminase-like cysteine proteinase